MQLRLSSHSPALDAVVAARMAGVTAVASVVVAVAGSIAVVASILVVAAMVVVMAGIGCAGSVDTDSSLYFFLFM